MRILVVPTIRESCFLEFMRAWEPFYDWDAIILVEDAPSPTFQANVTRHVAWDDIDQDLGEASWIISRHSAGIRSYGFLLAWRMGAEHIFTLDDDCFPISPGWCESHVRAMQQPAWTHSAGQRTRGMPYANIGTLSCVINHGLWSGIGDWDAIQSFSIDSLQFSPPSGSRIIPAGQYFPFCGMNFSFVREVTPLTYFPLMGRDSPYNRFDDIWFGVIAKRICDHLRLPIACGEPFVEHRRASDRFVNLIRESTGIQANERFWQTIADLPLSSASPRDCMSEIAEGLSRQSDNYFQRLGKAIRHWSELFIDG